MSLSAMLWEANADLAQAALVHPFVAGLRAGTLPRPAFQHYIGQDAFFLDAFSRAYALALAHCPDRAGTRDFFELLAGAQDEVHLHADYATQWDIALAEAVPTPATRACSDFLLATAALGGTGATCAAMAPCLRLYAYLGQALAQGHRAGANAYRAWIATYAAPAFASLAAQLESLLDRYATDSSAIRATYRHAMTLELAFFSASLAVTPVPGAGSGTLAGTTPA